MSGKKITIFIIITATLVIAGFLLAPRIAAYYEWQSIAEAASAFPWVDGGKIVRVTPVCLLDTPIIAPVSCDTSCPLLSPALKALCCRFFCILKDF